MASHHWVTVNLESAEGLLARNLVRVLAPEIEGYPNCVLTNLLRQDNKIRPIVEGWQQTSSDFLHIAITPSILFQYQETMIGHFPDGGFKDMVSVIQDWQDHLFDNNGALLHVPFGDEEDEEGQRMIVAFQEATTLRPGLRTNLLSGYSAIRTQYEEAKTNAAAVARDLDEFMGETWPEKIKEKFDSNMEAAYPHADISLYDTILTIQHPLCQASLDAEGPGF